MVIFKEQKNKMSSMITAFYYLDEFQAAKQGRGIWVESCRLSEETELRQERLRWLEFTGYSTGKE